MNGITSLQEVLRIEKSISTMIEEIKEQICAEIAGTELPQVKRLNSFCVVVRLSQLEHNIWTPEYYIPNAQANYVRKALEKINTARTFTEKVKGMIENRNVKINQNVHYLNDTTVAILMKYYNGFTEE